MKGKYYLNDLTWLGVTSGFYEKTKMTYITSEPTAEIIGCSRIRSHCLHISERFFRVARTNVGNYTQPCLHSHTCIKCCFVYECVSTMSLLKGKACDLFSKINV